MNEYDLFINTSLHAHHVQQCLSLEGIKRKEYIHSAQNSNLLRPCDLHMKSYIHLLLDFEKRNSHISKPF